MNNEKYIVTIFPTNKIATGAHKRYKELIEGLSARGYKVICYSPVNFFEEKIYKWIPISLSKKKLLPISLQLIKQVLKNTDVKKLRNNAVIITFGETTSLAGITLKKVIKSPMVLGVRTNVIEDRKIAVGDKGLKISRFTIKNKIFLNFYIMIFSIYEKMMYNNPTIITVQNKNDFEHVIQTSKNTNVLIIPNNINVSWLENELYKDSNVSSEIKKIVFIGGLIKRKGVFPLLEGYNQLVKEGYKIELHIFGEGPLEEQIKRYIKKESLNHVYLYGYTEEPLKYLSQMDLTIVPSLVDSFPNVIFESWYVGTPVIGTKVGGIQYQLKDEKLLFEPGKSKEIYKNIKYQIEEVKYKNLKHLSEERRRQFEFDWIGKYEEVIEKLVRKI